MLENNRIDQDILQRLRIVQLVDRVQMKNVKKETRRSMDYTALMDLHNIYEKNDPFEEDDDSISSFFDTIVFLACFLTYFAILIWVSVSKK